MHANCESLAPLVKYAKECLLSFAVRGGGRGGKEGGGGTKKKNAHITQVATGVRVEGWKEERWTGKWEGERKEGRVREGKGGRSVTPSSSRNGIGSKRGSAGAAAVVAGAAGQNTPCK